ncbi:MAG: hypothetical protein IT455_20905 [Planctomycetes bacterium]|nr:hypothetical protein [Planctomycetota bacterium]
MTSAATTDPTARWRRPAPTWLSATVLGLWAVVLAGAVAPFGWHCCSRRPGANESTTISRLRALAAAQAQVREQARIDRDGDGVGEFGLCGELAGVVPWRTGPTAVVTPPLLGPSWRDLDDGCVVIAGYRLRCCLRDRDGVWRAELGRGGAGEGTIDADAAEQGFVCHAWPESPGVSGRRSFLVDASGVVWATVADAPPFGAGREPVPGRAGCALPGAGAVPAADFVDGDGVRWFRVE